MKHLARAMLSGLVLLTMACGDTNIATGFVTKDSDKALIIDARKQIDAEEYSDAQETLAKVKGDTNNKRMLQVAATLGASGLSVWKIVLNVLDGNALSGKSTSGVDGILDSILGSVFGSGETRTQRLTALSTALDLIKTAPLGGDSKLKNTGCLLAAFLAAPRAVDAMASLTVAQSTLTTLSTKVSGTGSSAAECPNLDEFGTALTTLQSVRADFVSILDSVKGCGFITVVTGTATSGLNAVELQLNKLTTNADKGCGTITCTDAFCKALQFGCIQSLLADPSAVAGDGVIATCELIQNCIDPTKCFN